MASPNNHLIPKNPFQTLMAHPRQRNLQINQNHHQIQHNQIQHNQTQINKIQINHQNHHINNSHPQQIRQIQHSTPISINHQNHMPETRKFHSPSKIVYNEPIRATNIIQNTQQNAQQNI